jgi:hypothetical protein
MDSILKLVGLTLHHSQEKEFAITPKGGRLRKKAMRFIGPLPLAFTCLLYSCAAYGPYHANTSSEPLKSVRGPADGRYKLAFVEFGDQGSELDTSQRAAALEVIHQAPRPLLFVIFTAGRTTRTRAMSAGSNTSLILCHAFPRSLEERLT